MEKNNGFNSSEERSAAESDSEQSESAKDNKKSRRSPLPESLLKTPEKDKRQERVEPLGHIVLGEEAVTLFEQPKAEDKLQTSESLEATDDTELTPAQDAEITQQIIDERLPEIEAEIAAAETPLDEAVAEADETFLQNVRHHIETADTTDVEGAIDQAYEETIQQYQAEAAAPAPAEVPPIDPLEAARQAAEAARVPIVAPENPEASAPRFMLPDRPIEGAVSPSRSATLTTETAPDYKAPERPAAGNASGAALLLGYVLGRRGGRKRAEKRFAPIKQQLEARVRSLRASVSGGEARIRDLSRQQAQEQSSTPALKTPEVPTMPLPLKPVEAARPPILATPEAAPRPVAAPERLPQRPLEAAPPIRAEQLAKPQLLQVAEQIRIDGITVRSMREVGRFDDESLHRIVHEYLRGNQNIQRVVAEEVERHDRKRFERFETLNQVPPQQAAAPSIGFAGSSQTATDQHGSIPRPIAPASNSFNDQTPVHQANKPAGNQVSPVEKVVLGASVIFIVLAAVIITVVLTRR